MHFLFSFAIGIISISFVSALPSLVSVLAISSALSVAYFLRFKKSTYGKILFPFILGICYACVVGHFLMSQQLKSELAGRDLAVEGVVVGLPEENEKRQLFTLDVASVFDEQGNLIKHFPPQINISSYDALRVKTGEQWHLVVKLKVPRGFVNPKGFDYQASLLRRGIGATGYIRSGHNYLIKASPKFSMDVLRFRLQQWLINQSSSSQKGILIALLVGDTHWVTKEQWGEMINTGTNHLIAISGLHLGFFAIVGFYVGNFIGRFIQIIWHKYPSMIYGHLGAISCTFFYAILAGLNIPTVRTLIMLGIVQLMYLLRRNMRLQDGLITALVVVLIYDPLAALDIGFWLSFTAVALLMLCFSGRLSKRSVSGLRQQAVSSVIEFIKSQWVMFVGLLVPLSMLVHTSSLLSPAANLVAIPAITFFVVPCLILAAICFCCGFQFLENVLLRLTESGLDFVHHWLHWLLASSHGNAHPLVNINPLAIFLALLSALIILLPAGLVKKWFGFLGFCVALWIPAQPLPDLQILFFDVGQGTSVLVRTPEHQLLYDTGPAYTEKFDAGSGIIVPYLQSEGLKHLDKVIVSHNDLDHSGGLAGVLAATDVDQLWLGELEKYHPDLPNPTAENCHEQHSWRWGDVSFTPITWDINPSDKANNHSCVLLIEYHQQKILLTGDIEKPVEAKLADNPLLANVTVLMAPHHGSHTSSSPAFANLTNPQYVVYSAAYHSQHGHPHKDVQQRYSQQGAVALNTAFSGAVTFSWQQGALNILEQRKAAHRYWYSQQPD